MKCWVSLQAGEAVKQNTIYQAEHKKAAWSFQLNPILRLASWIKDHRSSVHQETLRMLSGYMWQLQEFYIGSAPDFHLTYKYTGISSFWGRTEE